MKKRLMSLLFATLLIGSFGMQHAHAKVIASAPAPKGFVYNKQVLETFDKLGNVKGFIKVNQSNALGNSRLTNHRPGNKTMVMPILQVYLNNSPDPVTYYLDGTGSGCPPGATLSFTIPDITNIYMLQLITLGDSFQNTESGWMTTNGGTVTSYGDVDMAGIIMYFSVPAITNGITLDIY
jgi:hypothetical protein